MNDLRFDSIESHIKNSFELKSNYFPLAPPKNFAPITFYLQQACETQFGNHRMTNKGKNGPPL